MAWAIILSVVLILLVTSTGFRKIALGTAVILSLGCAAYYAYDTLNDRISHSRIPAKALAFGSLVLKDANDGGYTLSGRIKNNSTRYRVTSIGIALSLRDCTTPLDAHGQIWLTNAGEEFVFQQGVPEHVALTEMQKLYGKSLQQPIKMKPTRKQLENALVAADTANDTKAAQMFANMISRGQYRDATATHTNGILVPNDLNWYDAIAHKIKQANCITIGEDTETAYLEIPPGHARDFEIWFPVSVSPKGRLSWEHTVTEVAAE